MQVILNKKEKERSAVAKLYEKGKPIREIAKQTHLSFGTIGKIIRRINGLDNDEIMSNDMRGKSKSSQAMNLFLHEKRPVEVAIEFDLIVHRSRKYITRILGFESDGRSGIGFI